MVSHAVATNLSQLLFPERLTHLLFALAQTAQDP